MDVDFCLDVLCEAVGVAGTVPTIINTDQGSQFTGVEWLSAVEGLGAQVSMDVGWTSRTLDGQRVDRTALAEREARVAIVAGIQYHPRVGGTAERVDRALQHVETSHREWRANTLASLSRTTTKARARRASRGRQRKC